MLTVAEAPSGDSASGDFNPPGIGDAGLPGPWWDFSGIGKYQVLVVLSVVLVAAFFVIAARKRQIVPGRLQFAGEISYNLVRNSIGKEIIGAKDFMTYVPLLFTLFFFILVNNIFGAIPFLEIPTFSHVGGAYVLAGLVYFTWIFVGFKKHGGSFMKKLLIPSGVPVLLLPVVVVIEIISNFLIRPMTHSLRLFATMLAGHMIVLVAGYALEFLATQENFLVKGTSLLIVLGFIAMYLLEVFIMVLQAYVFTLLTALYIQGSIDAGH